MTSPAQFYRSSAAGLLLAAVVASPVHAQEQGDEQGALRADERPGGNVFARPLPGAPGSAQPEQQARPPANVFALPRADADVSNSAAVASESPSRPLPDAVLDRWSRRHQAPGIGVSSFIVRPDVSAVVGIDTNPNRTPAGGSDLVATTRAAVAVESNWSRHQIAADASIEQRLFAQADELNQTPWELAVRGQLDVDHSSSLTANASAAQVYTDRIASEELDTTPLPTRYRVNQIEVGGEGQLGRLQLGATLSHRATDFDDTQTPAGITVDQQFRDVERASIRLTPAYNLTPTKAVFGTILADRLDYRLDLPRVRDSTGISLLAGVRGEISPLLRGQVAIGVLARDFKSSGYDEAARLAFDVQVDWLVTELSTVRLTANRRTASSGNIALPAELRTQVSLRVDHELRRDVLLSGRWTYRSSSYAGLGDRERQHHALLTADWFMTRHWRTYVSAEGVLRRGEIDLGAVSYDRIIVQLGLAYRL
jgi:hypothetical protein